MLKSGPWAYSPDPDQGGKTVSAMSVGEKQDSPILVVTGEESRLHRASEMIADGARLLRLCWLVEQAHHCGQRIERADIATREAVLHLLLRKDHTGAMRVAETLGPHLPDPLRMYVAESKARSRETVASTLTELADDRAWVVRCPVYTGHVIVLAPTSGPDTEVDPVEKHFREFASTTGGVHLGASDVVSVRTVADGYGQAIHALAAARNHAARYARFDPRDELEELLAPAGRLWAKRILAPLLDHVPDRPQDPDANELTATLESWLTFHTRASRQLKIHRNTLSARLGHIGRLLECDPYEIGTQAELNLALRLLNHRTSQATPDSAHHIEALLETAPVRHWAEHQLMPAPTGSRLVSDWLMRAPLLTSFRRRQPLSTTRPAGAEPAPMAANKSGM